MSRERNGKPARAAGKTKFPKHSGHAVEHELHSLVSQGIHGAYWWREDPRVIVLYNGPMLATASDRNAWGTLDKLMKNMGVCHIGGPKSHKWSIEAPRYYAYVGPREFSFSFSSVQVLPRRCRNDSKQYTWRYIPSTATAPMDIAAPPHAASFPAYDQYAEFFASLQLEPPLQAPLPPAGVIPIPLQIDGVDEGQMDVPSSAHIADMRRLHRLRTDIVRMAHSMSAAKLPDEAELQRLSSRGLPRDGSFSKFLDQLFAVEAGLFDILQDLELPPSVLDPTSSTGATASSQSDSTLPAALSIAQDTASQSASLNASTAATTLSPASDVTDPAIPVTAAAAAPAEGSGGSGDGPPGRRRTGTFGGTSRLASVPMQELELPRSLTHSLSSLYPQLFSSSSSMNLFWSAGKSSSTGLSSSSIAPMDVSATKPGDALARAPTLTDFVLPLSPPHANSSSSTLNAEVAAAATAAAAQSVTLRGKRRATTRDVEAATTLGAIGSLIPATSAPDAVDVVARVASGRKASTRAQTAAAMNRTATSDVDPDLAYLTSLNADAGDAARPAPIVAAGVNGSKRQRRR